MGVLEFMVVAAVSKLRRIEAQHGINSIRWCTAEVEMLELWSQYLREVYWSAHDQALAEGLDVDDAEWLAAVARDDAAARIERAAA